MSAAVTMQVTRGKLNRLAHVGLDSFAFRERAISDLHAALRFDAAAWWTIDPATALFTSCVFKPSPPDHAICAGVHQNELGDTDYNKFRVLARSTDKAGVLSAATGGQPERSDRYRHILAPLHYQHELRLALSDDSALWGGITLLREPGAPDFTPAEAYRVGSLGRILTEGLRPEVGSSWLPEVVRSVIARARQFHGGDAPEDGMSRARVRGASSRWLAICASGVRG